MKAKITDLMSLYEDEHCPLAPRDQSEQRVSAEQEASEVKQTKRRFGWKEGLSLAAALALVVLGGLGVKRLLDRSPAARQGSPSVQSSQIITEATYGPAVLETLEGAEREEINRFLTVFAQQGIENLDTDLDEDAELIRFAFIYRRLHDPESIRCQLQDEQLTDTLSPEQVNETLTRLLGKTVTPDENANYDLLRSEPVGGHCSYHDGCFWQEPSGYDQLLRFALAEQRDCGSGTLFFTVYAVNSFNWPSFELEPLPGLGREEAETLVREGKLTRCFYGAALLKQAETGPYLAEYRKLDVDVDPEPVTEPEQETEAASYPPEPSYDLDPVQLNALLTAFAEQGITDSDTELAGEYELAQFAHIWTKLHNYDAISWQTEDGESWETLTLEQVNETLTGLMGKTVSPAEGTDYTAQRGDNYAQHESYHDGRFWWPAADGDMRTRFAIHSSAALSWDDGRPVLSGGFLVYEADPAVFEENGKGLLDASPEDLMGLESAGKLRRAAEGEYRVAALEDSLTMLRWRQLSAEPEPGLPEDQSTAVDPAVRAEVEALFADPGSWQSRALTSRFAQPDQLSLYLLFYDGIPGESELTQAELDALGELHTTCDRLSPERMDQVLTRYFGVSLEQFDHLPWRRCLPETGCYYHEHGDTNVMFPEIIDVKARDGRILVLYQPQEYYTTPSSGVMPHWTVALRATEEGEYQVCSNLPGEWTLPEDAGALARLYRGTGAMRAETQEANGTRSVRELRLASAGQLSYRDGDPDSEFSHWESGSWWIVDQYTLALEHQAVSESGGWLEGEEDEISYYRCAIQGEELILTQETDSGFHDDAPNTTLRFRLTEE